MKKIILIILLILFTISTFGCGKNPDKDEDEVENIAAEETEPVSESPFVGRWICLRENSCNDMQIYLTITQENGELHIVRDMGGGSTSGSKISFSEPVPSGDSFSSLRTNGTYSLNDGILTEEFGGGKCNYFSATGSISVNICQFPFCSDSSGNSVYCEKHETEAKRYSGLSDSEKTSICGFINGRYEHYDKQNGGYSGDKYSEIIMKEAAEKYGLTEDHIYDIWTDFYE